MKHPIDKDFEKLILDGCRVISIQSKDYDSVNKNFTHALLECPKNYRLGEDKMRGAVKFIAIQIYDNEGWNETTMYYSTKQHAIKSFWDNLTEDRIYEIMKKENELIK